MYYFSWLIFNLNAILLLICCFYLYQVDETIENVAYLDIPTSLKKKFKSRSSI